MDRQPARHGAARSTRALMAALAVIAVLPVAARAQQAPSIPHPPKDTAPGLSNSAIQGAVSAMARGARPAGVQTSGDKFLVEVITADGAQKAVQQRIVALGGRLRGYAGGTLVEARVPADALGTLGTSEDGLYI